MSDIPDGADTSVAQIAVAWEIAKEAMELSYKTRDDMETDLEIVEVYSELFNKAYFSLLTEHASE